MLCASEYIAQHVYENVPSYPYFHIFLSNFAQSYTKLSLHVCSAEKELRHETILRLLAKT